jgi:hypothetical protein
MIAAARYDYNFYSFEAALGLGMVYRHASGARFHLALSHQVCLCNGMLICKGIRDAMGKVCESKCKDCVWMQNGRVA